jgi:hypothetical protein
MTVRVEAAIHPAFRKRWNSDGLQVAWSRVGDRIAAETPQMAQVATELAGPAAGLLYSLALWRIGADMGWAGGFVISNGLFSHWQVWLVLGVTLQFGGRMAGRHLRARATAGGPGRAA